MASWILLLALRLSGQLPAACVPGVPPGPEASDADFRLPALHAEPDPACATAPGSP